MKTWESPEMKVFNVKMDENIAASGDGKEYQTGYIYYENGGITRGGANYRYTSDGRIQDTSVSFVSGGGMRTVAQNKVSAISGCLV